MSELGSALGTRGGKLLGEAGVTAKEKLMSLIGSVPCLGEEHVAACPDRIMGCCGQSVKMDFCAIVHMAEWLIANGVVVREKSEWEPVLNTQGEHREEEIFARVWRCPVCGEEQFYGNFCYECGADMRRRENDGD